MAQISLYVPDDVLESLRAEASRKSVSISRLVLGAIEGSKREEGWPTGFFELYGACPDFPSADALREGLDPALDDECDWPGEA